MAIVQLWASTTVTADPMHAYRYEAREIIGGQVQTAYRMDFRLKRASDGSVSATVLSAWTSSRQGSWTVVTPPEPCRVLMRAPPGAVARVQVWPAPSGGDPLGSGFLDGCAPSEVFYPLTDILNTAIIPLAPQFGARELSRPGQAVRWPGVDARFARNGRRFQEHAPSGRSVLVSATRDEKVLDWLPDPAALDIEEQGATPTHFKGVENWAFRVRYDPRTSLLQAADTTVDDIDLVVLTAAGSSPNAPHVHLTRQVSIHPAPHASE